MKKNVKLLVIGDNCFDITIKSESDFDFLKDRNFIPDYYVSKPAGTGVNFAVSFSRLGGNTVYFTPVSRDSFGKEIKFFLSENGVKVTGKDSPLNTALIVAIVNNDGERTTFALIKNTSYTEISSEELKKTDLSDFDGIYISGGINTEPKVYEEMLKITDELMKSGKKIYFDPQIRIGKEIPGFTEVSERIACKSDIIFANSVEISNMKPDIFKNKFVVEKRGEKGAAVFKNGKEIFSVNGMKVAVKDTTGAGDVFNAAFLLSYLSGSSLEDSLKFANAAGAISVSVSGAYSPYAEEVESFIL